MLAIIFSVFHSIRQGLRARVALHVEIVALRHQLLVLRRSKRSHKLQLGIADRTFWVWLPQLWNGWRSALVIVKPETVIAWHRRGFRLYWSWKSRHPQGRPSVSTEVIKLIRKMSLANPRWGAPPHPR
jgi:putative transposase